MQLGLQEIRVYASLDFGFDIKIMVHASLGFGFETPKKYLRLDAGTYQNIQQPRVELPKP